MISKLSDLILGHIAVTIALMILALILIPGCALSAYNYFRAPHLKGLSYKFTHQTFDCLALITDGTCETEFFYTAKGTKMDAKMTIEEDLIARGFSITSDPADELTLDQSNGGLSISATKSSPRFLHPESMYVSVDSKVDPDPSEERLRNCFSDEHCQIIRINVVPPSCNLPESTEDNCVVKSH